MYSEKYQYKGYQVSIEKKGYGYNSKISYILPTGVSKFSRFVVAGEPILENCKKMTEERIDYLIAEREDNRQLAAIRIGNEK